VKNKIALLGLAASLAFVLTSCFVMQGFVLLASSVSPGGKTTARFHLRPASTERDRGRVFVLVGVSTGGDVTVGKATWGTNGKFAGPLPMQASGTLAGFVENDGLCSSNGIDFSNVTNIAWKGFTTPKAISDRGLVTQKAIVDVVVRAAASAGTDENYAVIGVSGAWEDDGDGVVEDADDLYVCTGGASTTLYVRP
jgi:hypothetical protein